MSSPSAHELLAGTRITTARIAVVEAVASLPGHPDADRIGEAVRRRHPGIHRATVYRTLETLTALGVLTHVHTGHGATTYHLSEPDRPHLHAQCRRCGTLIDLPSDALDSVRDRLQQNGFTLDADHVALSGSCQDCR